jgi:cyclophilin family peptidyl-prolyl cis-trans isomerase/HEAT repeat protein
MNPFFFCKAFCARAVSISLLTTVLLLVPLGVFAQKRQQILHNPTSGDPVPKLLLLRIVRAEDERRWDDDLRSLFRARNANVRSRAALAAGRIGNEAAVADLVELLQHDDETEVRAMAAFALGEIESPLAADVLVTFLRGRGGELVEARAIEALGKIVAALPKEQEARAQRLAEEILTVLGIEMIRESLEFELRRSDAPKSLTNLLRLTAVLRAKPADAGPVVAKFLYYSDPRIRADAANTLARLKLTDGNEQLRKLLISDPDPIVRANAARVLGATQDKTAYEDLLDRAQNDKDSRVRVSAIRALTTLKDVRVVDYLLRRGAVLAGADFSKRGGDAGEALEIATAFSRILPRSENAKALDWLHAMRERFGNAAPEIEVALVRISPFKYIDDLGDGTTATKKVQTTILLNWRAASSLAQGLGEIATLEETSKGETLPKDRAVDLLRAMLDYRNSGLTINTLVAVHSEYAVPDVLRAFAAFKPKDLAEVLRNHLKESDIIIRATAADLLGELPPDETNARALIDALPVALADKQLNDAALSILSALAKQKNPKANEAIKTALDSNDHLVRRRAVALLKTNGVGDFSARIGTVKTSNTAADYERAVGRIGKQVRAVVTTTKGSFTIEFLPADAPLTVDNFIQLAKRNYFNGFTVHRVVPNFVIQDGDPRGDGNGGPGYQIRCEINEAPYERGAVGMALSGKDTGGSQWFVTHSPQPHLDGGYTVFGNVISGMDVVDNIMRGDVIRSVAITERKLPANRKQ